MDINIGKLYSNNDMVKVGCHDCRGCSSCCRDMGQSIWLDPYDVYQMTMHLGKNIEQLLTKEVELHVEDGLILPNIRMVLEGNEEEPSCSFLDEQGRCSIHECRPGFCRLFPLGRSYEGDAITYFLLEDACPMQGKTKMKVNKWLNMPRIKDYEHFLAVWHGLTKGLRAFYADNADNDAVIKAVNMKFLQMFYLTPYEDSDFYLQFHARMESMNVFLKQMGIFL